MQKSLLFKISTVVALCGMFLFGLLFLSSLVDERKHYAREVFADIEQNHVSQQLITTPFIVIPNHQGIYIPEFPASTNINSQAKVSDNDYKRGIYHAISYNNHLHIQQSYQFADMLQNPIPEIVQPTSQSDTNSSHPEAKAEQKTDTKTPTKITASYQWQQAKLIIPISDLRGVATTPKIIVNDKTLTATFPKRTELNGLNYMEVDLSSLFNDKDKRQILLNNHLNFDIKLDMAGIRSINMLPLGQQFKFTLQSNWTEPKFFGSALPTKQFSPAGFTATWQNQFLAISNNQMITDCFYFNNSCINMNDKETIENIAERQYSTTHQWISTAFVDSNNTYTQTDRTLKYALLLLIVSFATFFLFEVLKQLRIHPIQYGLVAMALLVFYVLLLSLAEQTQFWQAYIVATLACVGLIGWYTSFVLQSLWRGLGFSTILLGLYAGFYLILASEDMNLLLGAIFCFILLAVVMYLTRKVDWYQIGNHHSN